MDCKAFFASEEGNNDKCKTLQQREERHAWQVETASEHSPHPVNDEEVLLRQIFSPHHIDSNSNLIKPNGLDDVFNKGLSTNREKFLTLSDTISMGTARATAFNEQFPDKPKRKLLAVSRLLARTVRDIQHPDGQPSFGIYDTANEENPSHADIFHISVGPEQKAIQRSVRSKLLDLANSQLKLL